MPTQCLCGAPDCRSCGPPQGWPWCFDHNQSAQYCCSLETSDEMNDYSDEECDNEEPEEDILNANRLENGWY